MANFSESPFKVAQVEFSPEDALETIDRSLAGREHLVGSSEVRELLASRAFFNRLLEQEEGVAA